MIRKDDNVGAPAVGKPSENRRMCLLWKTPCRERAFRLVLDARHCQHTFQH
jgi:hypothetical protein